MKNIIIFLICCCACNVFISCYEDKGNYSYKDRGDIVLEEWKEKYTVVSLSDTLDIMPQLPHSEAYDYLWLLYNERTSLEFDTIGLNQHLLWPVSGAQGNYKLLLKVTAQSDGYAQAFHADVEIVAEFSNGWFVVKSQDEETDIDFFSLEAEKFTDLLSQSTGRKLAGNAQGVSLIPNFTLLDTTGEITRGLQILHVLSEDDCWMVNLADMSVVRDFSKMFFGSAVAGDKPRTIVPPLDKYGMNFFTDHHVHYANAQGQGTGQFGLALNCGKEILPGECVIKIKPGVIFYDQKNYRFVSITYQGKYMPFAEDPKVAGVIPPVSMNNTGCKMEYMGINKYDSEFFYAFMSNVSKAEKYIYSMYTPQNPPYGASDKRQMGDYNCVYSIDTLDSSFGMNQATLFAIGSNLSYIYYNSSSGDAIHFYDVKGKRVGKNVFLIPAGERVTYIKSWYYDVTEEEGKFDKFVIATEKDGQYKVYLYDLLAGKPHPDKKPQVLTGEGIVGAVQPIRSSMMKSGNTAKVPANF